MKIEDFSVFALQPGANPAGLKEKYEKEVERYNEQMRTSRRTPEARLMQSRWRKDVRINTTV